MSEEIFYRCIPELNKDCKKNNCFINGGECETTIHKEYTFKGLLEEIERLNNIINEIKPQLDYLEIYSNKKEAFKDIKRRLDRIKDIVNGK